MKLWLKADERRPTPPPVPTDDATALLVGSALWLIGLIAVIVAPMFGVDVPGDVVSTVVIALVLGSVGLVYLRLRG